MCRNTRILEMPKKRRTRTTRNGKAPVRLSQLCSSPVSSPGAIKTSPQQPPRWPTRSPTPPWTSIRPRGPSTSSSLASEQRGPSVPPGGASVPDVLNFPGKDNWHLLRDAAPWGSLTQSRAPFLCLKFPCLKLEMVRQNLFSRERWLVSFEIIVPPKGH